MSNREADITRLLAIFNGRFERFGLALTSDDYIPGESRFFDNGDEAFPTGIDYRFGEDTDGLFLDYYFCENYRTEPDHARLYPDGSEKDLPTMSPGYRSSSTATEEEKRQLEEEYYTENRKIRGMLHAKGFCTEYLDEDAPAVQVVYVCRRDTHGNWATADKIEFAWLGNHDDALGAAMWLVDDYLEQTYRHGMGLDELLARYRLHGPDPFIIYENRSLARAANPVSAWFLICQPIPFNAWGYAEEVARRLCGEPEREISRSLASWQGRYDRYDRHCMEAQLFLNRAVRVTRDIDDGKTCITAGSVGKIAAHNRQVDTDQYDYTRETPVMFESPLRLPWRRAVDFVFGKINRDEPVVMAIPYDALEFVESDAEYAAEIDETYREIRS